jgi:hypothetical protein
MLRFVASFWILFDVGICLRTGYMTAPLPRWEWWTWLLSGGALAMFALIADHLDRQKNDRVMTKLNDQLVELRGVNIGAASVIGQSLQRIEVNAEQSGNSKLSEEVIGLRKELEQQIKELSKQAPRRISAEQRKKFRDSLAGKTPRIWETYCVSTDSEADSYAKQLTRMFREAGMSAGYSISTDIDSPALDQFGLTIHYKIGDFPDDTRDLAWAFDQAGIKYGLTNERVVPHADPRYVGLRVGRKPE